MRGTNKLLLVLLVTSVCFNLLFIAGYYRSRAVLEELKTPEGRTRLMAEELELTPSQAEQVTRLKTQLRAEMERIREAGAAESDAFWGEVIKDDPDPQKVKDLVEATSGRWMESRLIAAEYLRRIFALLTPQQRGEFVKMLRLRSFFGAIKTKYE